jgi:hypothetical protein
MNLHGFSFFCSGAWRPMVNVFSVCLVERANPSHNNQCEIPATKRRINSNNYPALLGRALIPAEK